MFLDTNAIADTSITSPWAIKTSKWRAQYNWRLLTKVSHKGVYRYMYFTSVPLMVVALLYFSMTFVNVDDTVKEWAIIPMILLLPIMLFQLWRVIAHDRINRQPRKYFALPGDYSYDSLFRHTRFVATDDELREIPDLRHLIDTYFTSTYDADMTIRRSRLEHHNEKALVDYAANGVRQDIANIVRGVRYEKAMNG